MISSESKASTSIPSSTSSGSSKKGNKNKGNHKVSYSKKREVEVDGREASRESKVRKTVMSEFDDGGVLSGKIPVRFIQKNKKSNRR